MFSRTKIAKEFRKWVLDILDKEIGSCHPNQLPSNPRQFITPAQAGELYALIHSRFSDGKGLHYAWKEFNTHFRIASDRKFSGHCGFDKTNIWVYSDHS